MRPLFRSLATAAVILACALGASAETFKLRYERLEPQLDELTDHDIVSDATNLIKEGEHVRRDPAMAAEVRELEQELANQ